MTDPRSPRGEIVAQEGCCVLCDEMFRDSLTAADLGRLMRPFIVCPTCGNKRCPKATDHRFDCTGSNEPGQHGSRYQFGPVGVLTAMSTPAEF